METDEPLSPNESLNNSLNESQSSCGIGKTILAVHNKGDSSTFKGYDDGSVSVSSFSEGGFMADISESERTSVSETSDYFSGPVASSLLVDSSVRQAARPKRKVKRKAGSKKKEPTADSKKKSTTATATTRRKKATKKKPLNKKKSAEKNDSSDYLHAEFNASKVNSGASMQDFLTDSQTEGETENEANKKNTRPSARRKRKVKRWASYDHSSSRLSLTDASGSKNNQSVSSRLSINEPRTKKPQHKVTSDAEKSDSKKSRTVKRRSTKGKDGKKATRERKADDEKSFAEGSIDDASITLESLYPTTGTPASDAVKPKLLLEQSIASLQKDASLDLAKHGPVAKGRKSITLNLQASGNPHRGRSLSPESKRRESSARQKTISETKQKAESRSKSPRRIKSHNATIQSHKKLIRRTKSDEGPGDQQGQPRRARSSSTTKKQPKTTFARPVKQRSQSLTLAAQSSTKTCRRRRLQSSVSSKVSLSMSLTAMDKSFQSMPSNVPRRPSISLPAQPLKDTLGDTQSTSTDINKKTVKRSTSASSKAATGPKTVTTRKKRLRATSKHPGAAKPIPPKPASKLGQDGSILSGRIAKKSPRHSNFDPLPSVSKKKANDPISPFSLRANLEDAFLAGENDDDNDDVFSRSEVSTSSTLSGTSSNSGGQTRTTAASSTSAGSLQGLSKSLPPTRRSGTPNNLPPTSSYFGRDEETHNSQDPLGKDSTEKAGDSMSGSLLSDYSSSDNETTTKKTQKGALGLSSSDVSSDAMGQSRLTISPFSVHAGGISSNHTTATLLATEHTATPLIPDSDDETSDSFLEENPQLISSMVDEAPPPTRKSPPKQSVSKVTDPPARAQKPHAKTHKQRRISFPQPNQNSEKPKVDDQLNPVPQTFWQMLCCRSWRHAREV